MTYNATAADKRNMWTRWRPWHRESHVKQK